jgi:hypothetical protein
MSIFFMKHGSCQTLIWPAPRLLAMGAPTQTIRFSSRMPPGARLERPNSFTVCRDKTSNWSADSVSMSKQSRVKNAPSQELGGVFAGTTEVN